MIELRGGAGNMAVFEDGWRSIELDGDLFLGEACSSYTQFQVAEAFKISRLEDMQGTSLSRLRRTFRENSQMVSRVFAQVYPHLTLIRLLASTHCTASNYWSIYSLLDIAGGTQRGSRHQAFVAC